MQDEQQSTPDENDKESFAKELTRDVSKGLLEEAGTTIKWGIGGAIIGGAGLGIFAYTKFGAKVGVIGAIVGAVVGGVLGAVVYIQGSSLLS